ncbi:MAG: FtsX-like permease family protein, partial [Gammaproteobacteria bacterium]|nr:FtsX-like permease family protein [Gammaproteobacteria bacterium]
SVFVAFLLFALLSAIGKAFTAGEDVADAERLIVLEKVSIINSLPEAYQDRIASVPGVEAVTHANWFGGYYQEKRNERYPQFPVKPLEYFSLYPEFQMPEEQLRAWANNRQGAVVGDLMAEALGWEVGDRVPITATIFPKTDGSMTWELDIEGIFSSDDPRLAVNFMLFQYDYFDEARAHSQGSVGWYILRVEDGADPVAVANAIDTQFQNSPYETDTATEAAFNAAFAAQLGNIALIVSLILGAVFFTLLLVSGNTMSQSVRERIAELAVLKTVGFENSTVLGIVLSESILIMLLGGLLGLGTGWLLIKFGGFLPGAVLPFSSIVTALGFMLGAGLLAGLFPALKAMRLSIIDALAVRA